MEVVASLIESVLRWKSNGDLSLSLFRSFEFVFGMFLSFFCSFFVFAITLSNRLVFLHLSFGIVNRSIKDWKCFWNFLDKVSKCFYLFEMVWQFDSVLLLLRIFYFSSVRFANVNLRKRMQTARSMKRVLDKKSWKVRGEEIFAIGWVGKIEISRKINQSENHWEMSQ